MPDHAHNSSETDALLAQLSLAQDIMWQEIDKHVENMCEKIDELGEMGTMAAFLGGVVRPMETAMKDTQFAHAILELAKIRRKQKQRAPREIEGS
jgi:hypothetical protein